MSREWMRVISSPEPRVLSQAPFGSSRRRGVDRRLCPSLITFSKSVPTWLGIGQDFEVDAGHGQSAIIKQIKQEDSIWINVLDPSDGNQSNAQETVFNPKCTYLTEQDPLMFLPRISYLMSDVIIFSGTNVDEAGDQYLHWLHSCRGLYSDKPLQGVPEWHDHFGMNIKPHTCIIVRDADENSIREEFMTSCQLNTKAGDLNQQDLKRLDEVVFQECEFLIPSDSLRDTIIRHTKMARRLREGKKRLWSEPTFNTLHAALVDHLAEQPRQQMNLVRTLSSSELGQKFEESLWPDLTCMVRAANEDMESFLCHFLLPVMGSCFANNTLKQNHVFAASEAFEFLYRDTCNAFLSETPRQLIHLQTVKQRMESSFFEYEKQSTDPFHFQMLGSYERYWCKVFSKEVCFGCWISCCQVFLPCGHALCEACYRHYVRSNPTESLLSCNGPLPCSVCPLCQGKLDDFSVLLPPPTASARVLILDGGGICGIVALRVLEMLVEEIRLDIPFHLFFDAIWGTSIGGIIAIQLGMMKLEPWKCIENFPRLAKTLFTPPSSWLDSIGAATTVWRKALKVFQKEHLYDEPHVDAEFRRAISEDMPMLGAPATGHVPKVGVTTIDSASEAGIIANYNWPSQKAVSWLRTRTDLSKIKAWEAARCTSAAPIYFPPGRIDILPHTYFTDGGLRNNYPGYVAVAEARALFPRSPDPLFVTIGCGQYEKTSETPASSWMPRGVQRLYTEWVNCLDPEEQYQRHQSDSTIALNRLNPRMHMQRPNLDQFSALEKLNIADSRFYTDCIVPTAWRMLASMFYFEFMYWPEVKNGRLQCTGRIHCRYCRQGHQDMSTDAFRTKASFCLGQKRFNFEIPANVNFELRDMNESFEIYLRSGKREAAISGFPNSAARLLELQENYQQGYSQSEKKRSIVDAGCNAKRQRC